MMDEKTVAVAWAVAKEVRDACLRLLSDQKDIALANAEVSRDYWLEEDLGALARYECANEVQARIWNIPIEQIVAKHTER